MPNSEDKAKPVASENTGNFHSTTKENIMENSKNEATIAAAETTVDLSALPEAEKQKLSDSVTAEFISVLEKQLWVGVFGDTGVGKSTLCNALFGEKVAETSEVKACTREPQVVILKGEGQGGIVLVDMPGVGEDPEHHQKYSELYDRWLPDLDMGFWCIKADDRKYATSIDVYNRVLKPHKLSRPVVFVITQSDKMEPYREWDKDNKKPSPTQLKHLDEKKDDVAKAFDVPKDKIIAVSATEGYNLVELVELTVRELSNPNKFPFIREVKPENVSEAAIEDAAKGILDHLTEFAGGAWDVAKEVVTVAREIPKQVASGVLDAARKVASTVVDALSSKKAKDVLDTVKSAVGVVIAILPLLKKGP